MTNTTVVNSQTMAELLYKIAALGLIGPIAGLTAGDFGQDVKGGSLPYMQLSLIGYEVNTDYASAGDR